MNQRNEIRGEFECFTVILIQPKGSYIPVAKATCTDRMLCIGTFSSVYEAYGRAVVALRMFDTYVDERNITRTHGYHIVIEDIEDIESMPQNTVDLHLVDINDNIIVTASILCNHNLHDVIDIRKLENAFEYMGEDSGLNIIIHDNDE